MRHTAIRGSGARGPPGGSQGAAIALAISARLSPRPVGVVSLSAKSTAGSSDALASAAAYPGPVLLVGTEDDVDAPGGVTCRIAEVHRGDEQVLLFPGSEYGIELLPRTQDRIEAFIARVLPPP